MEILVSIVVIVFSTVITFVVVRQILFTCSFLLLRHPGRQWSDLEIWPSVTVLIAAHNEELVIDGCLHAMRQLDYPEGKIEIVVVNDRSTDRTRDIVENHAIEDQRIRPVHRPAGAKPGKPAALKETIDTLTSEIVVFFDADYLPSPGLLRRLVAPFQDPLIGATMGRVVPYNTDKNLLTRLIDLERRAGYVVDQQIRGTWGFLPQFGGTTGGVRLAALRDVGGWHDDVLTEDTDLTYRLFLAGYDVAYLRDALCYEESPEEWPVRFRQVRRWAYGHNVCMFRYLLPVLLTSRRPIIARLDAGMVLLFYAVPFLAILTLIIFLTTPFLWSQFGSIVLGVPIIVSFAGFGNFAPYFQIAAGCIYDRQPNAFTAAPLIFLSSFISMIASTSAILSIVRDWALRRTAHWDKTLRFRT
ncbi:MAG: glycosyltransferase family 2 protein [Paracoccaceae bacterium]|nr:glycosyltransferase family 2 protein [Paracoccaceae bacterium]